MKPFSLFRDPDGTLALFVEHGRKFPAVEPVRLFPLTSPDRWVSICDADQNELVCIDDTGRLPSQTRRLLEEELRTRSFLPNIRKIVKVSAKADPSEWQVETDRGATTFLVNDEDDVHRLGGGRILIIDSHGTRYLIPNVYRLDSASRKSLAYFL